jgi:hypothetical protein
MALANKTRFIAAATLTAILTAIPAIAQSAARQAAGVQLAEEKMGKEIRVGEELKRGKAGQSGKPAAGNAAGNGNQTAKKPEQGDGDEFGVERPAPEDPDPNAVEGGDETGGGEKPLNGGGKGVKDLPPVDE